MYSKLLTSLAVGDPGPQVVKDTAQFLRWLLLVSLEGVGAQSEAIVTEVPSLRVLAQQVFLCISDGSASPPLREEQKRREGGCKNILSAKEGSHKCPISVLKSPNNDMAHRQGSQVAPQRGGWAYF